MESAEKIRPNKKRIEGFHFFVNALSKFVITLMRMSKILRVAYLRKEFSKQSCSNPSVRRPQNYADDTHDDYDGEIEL